MLKQQNFNGDVCKAFFAIRANMKQEDKDALDKESRYPFTSSFPPFILTMTCHYEKNYCQVSKSLLNRSCNENYNYPKAVKIVILTGNTQKHPS